MVTGHKSQAAKAKIVTRHRLHTFKTRNLRRTFSCFCLWPAACDGRQARDVW